MAHVQLFATVRAVGPFVAAVSSGRSPIAASSAGFSTATTAAPCPGISHCSSAPSDVPVEIVSHILSANTPGFAAAAIAASSFAFCLGIAFAEELSDLDWGSWEGSLPESSSLGGDATPLRGAFTILPSGGIKNSLRGTLYQLCRIGDILAAVNSRQPGPFWSAKVAHSFAATDT